MKKEELKLHDLVCGQDPDAITAEIISIVGMVADDFDSVRFRTAMQDLVRLFGGEYPGFRASNTSYHDLEHTCAVVLAVARLLHGLQLDNGIRFSGAQVLVALMAAIFHDTGLILKTEEQDGSGARNMVGHEKRSIELAANYMESHGFGAEERGDCGAIIMATMLGHPLPEIPFRDEATLLLGKVLGSADLVAQMADRAYLEKLLLLYREFVEAGVKGYQSELDLLRKTSDFYRSLAQPRLVEDMDNVKRVLRSHFWVRWGIDRDLYAEAIDSNLFYLEKLLNECGDAYTCYQKKLNRGGGNQQGNGKGGC
ncbi:MAG: HD domain-containing protein [Desulfobulbaceae bacterium]|nr:HD domain-containing protein [Desulfobulbaceae bacterium]